MLLTMCSCIAQWGKVTAGLQEFLWGHSYYKYIHYSKQFGWKHPGTCHILYFKWIWVGWMWKTNKCTRLFEPHWTSYANIIWNENHQYFSAAVCRSECEARILNSIFHKSFSSSSPIGKLSFIVNIVTFRFIKQTLNNCVSIMPDLFMLDFYIPWHCHWVSCHITIYCILSF